MKPKKQKLECEKCGGRSIRIRYHEKAVETRYKEITCESSDYNKERSEHLHYFCETCLWDWTGPVKENVKKHT